MPPYFVFSFLTSGQLVSLLLYLFMSLLIVWAADQFRRITKRLEDEESFRKLAVEELAHRLKNKIATIQSIVSFQLRDDPQAKDTIVRRLMALSATDDLILATQGRGAGIRDILYAELGPHDVSRVSMAGPDVFLRPKLALTMALLVHELATNAAKHGALSCEAGQVSIRWSLSDERLSLEWRERNGPTVATPLNYGFGMRLLSRALEQFGGTVETTFEPTGFSSRMKVALPADRPDMVTEGARQAAA
jgi:two-component sensor histidine kinase